MNDDQPVNDQDTENIPEIDMASSTSYPFVDYPGPDKDIFYNKINSQNQDHVTSEDIMPIRANLVLSKHVDMLLTTFLIVCLVCACMMAILIIIFINKAMSL